MGEEFQPIDAALNFILLGLMLGSAAALFWAFQRHIGGRALLAYEPRRPVPWSFLAPALMLAPAMLNVAAWATPLPVETATEVVAPVDAGGNDSAGQYSAAGLTMQAATFVGVTLACIAAIAALYGANARDLGLPSSARELAGDVGAGAVAYLVVLIPVYGVNVCLNFLVEPAHGHPLIEDLTQHSTSGLMAAAVAAAVIAAPLFEETSFRLVFQGWLENHETGRVQGAVDDEDAGEPVVVSVAYADAADGTPAEGALADAAPAADATPAAVGEDAGDVGSESTLKVIHYAPDRPCNWAAICVSSALFALAHVGQGVAPFSLFPLGLALGYLYQRTHRIVPSMVCHALFNATSLVALWLALSGGKQ